MTERLLLALELVVGMTMAVAPSSRAKASVGATYWGSGFYRPISQGCQSFSADAATAWDSRTKSAWAIGPLSTPALLASSPGIFATGVATAPRDCKATPAGPVPTQPHRAVARVIAGQWKRNYGTGTVVAAASDRAWLVTCAHLFQGIPRGGAGPPVVALFPDGQRGLGRLIALDETWDLALVELPGITIQAVKVAEHSPQVGQWLTSCGYGSEGQFACNRGQLQGYVSPGRSPIREMFTLSGKARQGDSGGPVFDSSGQLVGVLWGSDGQVVVATGCSRLREFLRRVLPEWERHPGASPPRGSEPPPGTCPAPCDGDRHASESAVSRTELAALAERVRKLEQEVGLGGSIEAPTRRLSERLRQLEEAAALLPALRQRVTEAEQALGSANLRAVVRDVALGLLAEQTPSVVDRLVPRLVEALGWTTPPSLALVLASRLLARLLARRAGAVRRQLRRHKVPSARSAPTRESPAEER